MTAAVVRPTSRLQTAARWGLGSFLAGAGITHLTVAREGFRAQVPDWVPIDVDDTVVISGCAEIALGTALIAFPKERVKIGTLAAAFFTGIFPGNIAQYRHSRDGLTLDTDRKRLVRLFFQPVMIGVALWSTGTVPRR